MSMGNTLTFHLPQGWTVREVATAMVREWMQPLRSEPPRKGARWIVQSVVDPDKTGGTLWEPGIATSEYEERLGRADLCWAVKATAGRGKSSILARFSPSENNPDTFELACSGVSFPETLFDSDKLDDFLKTQNKASEELFPALLSSHGFEAVG